MTFKPERLLFTLLFSVMSTSFALAQQSPEQVVQTQLDTYNNRDIDGFMATMSQDVELFSFGDPKPSASGYSAVKNLYTSLFEKSPKLHSTLTNRIVLGNKVLDHESITGRMGNAEVLELVVIYEVKDEKIFKVTVLRK
ncbi:MAG: hypothetical protein Roseis2KO_41290 [Roseivirga sp.]